MQEEAQERPQPRFPVFFSAADAAERLGVSTTTLVRDIRSGSVPVIGRMGQGERQTWILERHWVLMEAERRRRLGIISTQGKRAPDYGSQE